jgi:hypothetical protein
VTEAATTSDPLALKQCPRCDYSLTGLPEEGICPECGQPYDRRFMVLFGDARGRFSGMHNAGRRGLALHAVWLVVFSIMMWFSFSHRLQAGALLFIPLLMFPLAVRFLNPRQSRTMVVLDERGIGQGDTLDPASPLAKSMIWIGWIMAAGWLLFLALNDRRAWTGLIGGAIGVGIGLAIRFSAIRERRRRTLEVPGPSGWPIKLARWAYVETVDIQPVTGTRVRIRVWGHKLRYLGKWYIADAEVDLDTALVGSVRERVTACLVAGKRIAETQP